MSRWEVPDGWEWVKAYEIADIIGGGTPPSKDPRNFSTDGIPWLTPADLTGYRDAYIGHGARDLSELGLSKSSARILPKGAVLFTSRAPIGYCAIASQPLATNQGFKSLVLLDGIAPEFLRHYLLASKDYAESLSSGTTFRELSTARMKELEIPLAPTPEQRRIVAKIEALQERSRRAREALVEVGPLLEQFRQSVLAAAFRGDLTADWRAAHPNIEPASELLHRIRTERRRRWEQAELAKYEVKGQEPPKNWKEKYEEPEPVNDSGLPELPYSWCWVSLDDLLSEPLANGRSVKDGNGFPVLRLTALKKRRIDLSERKLGAWNAIDAVRFVVQKGDFLVSRGNGSIDLVGRGGLVINEPGGQVAYPDTMIRVRITNRFDRDLLALLWDSAVIRHQIETAAHTTAGIHKVSQSDLQQILIPLPPLEEQEKIVLQVTDRLDTIERLAGKVSQALNVFDQLDQAILVKAFRGELVPQDPNDEPTSALLERIREQRAQQVGVTKRNKQISQTQEDNKPGKKVSRLTPEQLTLAKVL
jgi:type I restriction enzyme S subunit